MHGLFVQMREDLETTFWDGPSYVWSLQMFKYILKKYNNIDEILFFRKRLYIRYIII